MMSSLLGLPSMPSGSYLRIIWLNLSEEACPFTFQCMWIANMMTSSLVRTSTLPWSIFSLLPFPKDCNLLVTWVSFLARMQELGVEWRVLELRPSALGSRWDDCWDVSDDVSGWCVNADFSTCMSKLCASCQFLLLINCPVKGFPVLPVPLLHVDMAPVMGSACLTCQLYSEISNLLLVQQLCHSDLPGIVL